MLSPVQHRGRSSRDHGTEISSGSLRGYDKKLDGEAAEVEAFISQGDSAKVAWLRLLCEGAGGKVFAKRVMRLLRTNLLSIQDIQSMKSEGTPQQAKVGVLEKAGLSRVEAMLLLVHMEAFGPLYPCTRSGENDGIASILNCFVFQGSIFVTEEVLGHLLLRLSLEEIGRIGGTCKAFNGKIRHKDMNAIFQHKCSTYGISKTLVPTSWRELMKEACDFSSNVVRSGLQLLEPVLRYGTLKTTGNSFEFSLPVSYSIPRDPVFNPPRWSIGHHASLLAPCPKILASLTVWCVAVPFFRSSENSFGEPLSCTFERVLNSNLGWNGYEGCGGMSERQGESEDDNITLLVNQRIEDFMQGNNMPGPFQSHPELTTATETAFEVYNKAIVTAMIKRTTSVLECCRLSASETFEHMVQCLSGDALGDVLRVNQEEFQGLDAAIHFKCPIPINTRNARNTFVRRMMEAVGQKINPEYTASRNTAATEIEGVEEGKRGIMPNGRVDFHSNIYRVNNEVHLRGVAPWTWESPFTPPIMATTHLGRCLVC